MGFFTCRATSFDKLVTRLKALLRSEDDVPYCAWEMLTELGEASKDYNDLVIARLLRDQIHTRMMEQANKPIPDFIPSKR